MSPPNHVFRVRFNFDAIAFGGIKNESITGEWFGYFGSFLPCWQVYRLFLKFLLNFFVLLVNFKREHFLIGRDGISSENLPPRNLETTSTSSGSPSSAGTSSGSGKSPPKKKRLSPS